MTVSAGIRQYRTPNIGFAADTARHVEPIESRRSGRFIPEYAWPELEFGRSFNFRLPGAMKWYGFMSEVERRIGRRRDVDLVTPEDLRVVYIAVSDMQALFDAAHRRLVKDKDDGKRQATVNKTADNIAAWVRSQIANQMQSDEQYDELVSLGGCSDIDTDEVLPEPSRRWENRFFAVDTIKDGDAADRTSIVLPIVDRNGVMAHERHAFLSWWESRHGGSSELARLSSQPFNPSVTIAEAVYPLPSLKTLLPECPCELPLGSPAAVAV